MTDADLAAIAARNGGRTPGEWEAEGPHIMCDVPSRPNVRRMFYVASNIPGPGGEFCNQDANQEFIANAPRDITNLLSEVTRLRELMSSIYRDALLELPAVEEAIRQERARVVGRLVALKGMADERVAGDVGVLEHSSCCGASIAYAGAIVIVNGGEST